MYQVLKWKCHVHDYMMVDFPVISTPGYPWILRLGLGSLPGTNRIPSHPKVVEKMSFLFHCWDRLHHRFLKGGHVRFSQGSFFFIRVSQGCWLNLINIRRLWGFQAKVMGGFQVDLSKTHDSHHLVGFGLNMHVQTSRCCEDFFLPDWVPSRTGPPWNRRWMYCSAPCGCHLRMMQDLFFYRFFKCFFKYSSELTSRLNIH